MQKERSFAGTDLNLDGMPISKKRSEINCARCFSKAWVQKNSFKRKL